MTIKELIYRILNILSVNTEDSLEDYPEELIYRYIIDKRAMLLKQQYKDARKAVSRSCYQLLHVPLTRIKAIKELPYTETLLISEDIIPEIIDFTHDRGVATTLILRDDKTASPINLVSFERFPYVGNNKWTVNQIYATIGKDRLYLRSQNTSFTELKNVDIFSVFVDPLDVYKLNNITSESGDEYDLIFPIDQSMIDSLIKLVLAELGVKILPKDTNNNSEGVLDNVQPNATQNS